MCSCTMEVTGRKEIENTNLHGDARAFEISPDVVTVSCEHSSEKIECNMHGPPHHVSRVL